MADSIAIDFQPLGPVSGGDLVVLVGDDLALSPAALERVDADLADLVRRAAAAERFKGKAMAVMVLPAPREVAADRIIVVGLGPQAERDKLDWTNLGAAMAARFSGRTATIVADWPGGQATAQNLADLALGARLRSYKFDRYKTKKPTEDEGGATRLVLMTAEPAVAKKAAKVADGLAAAVVTARDLVNEPPNVLDPEEFANRALALEKLGVEVEVLDEKAMRKLGMRALLAVAQGSTKEARLVVMRWNGGARDAQPIAFIGKGVTFDSGGISIKPGGGMEDMKGDMAGAACVVGLMQALAARKAKANVIGAIGVVENMPDGNAQRPGDIVTSLSGQTIEIINTDAEGRLVLADVLWHVKERHKPKFMIDLATLTGAILVALGQEHAGLFSNDDELANRLLQAGLATGEKVWRMPLTPEYDKMIDSKFADMKNTGGRHAGSVTAAQFLKRYVADVPWAHLDIAGTGFSAPQTEINKSWGSGWGVRLLDRLVRDHYEG